MEHKRDATVAGLAWPSNPTRGLAPANPVQVPDTQAAALCHSGLSDPPTNTTSAPLATDSTAPDLGTTVHSDTYSGLAPPECPVSDGAKFYTPLPPSCSLLFPRGSPDPIQDLYPLQQHQGTIH